MFKALVFPIAYFAAACSPPASGPEAKAGVDSMGMSAPEAAGPIRAVGIVTAIDAAAGTISLDHEPIARFLGRPCRCNSRSKTPPSCKALPWVTACRLNSRAPPKRRS